MNRQKPELADWTTDFTDAAARPLAGTKSRIEQEATKGTEEELQEAEKTLSVFSVASC